MVFDGFTKHLNNLNPFCNFACTKEKLSQKIGCRLPWDKWSAQDRPICKSDQEFEQFEQIHEKFLYAESYQIIDMSGCKKPCTYNEYKFATSSPEIMPKTDLKSTSAKVGFWVASSKTWIEEEVLLYSFTSLIAEFGGSLGLFLGFSFMTIWQEVRGCCCK